jgi:pullulanase/glycogen debranching enzyme
VVKEDLSSKYYGYKVRGKDSTEPLADLPLCVDPYAKAFASFTTYNNPRKSIVYNQEYNWYGDTWIQRDWRDLIIYEMHVRDMTAHPSSGAQNPGTYKGLSEKFIKGGLDYIKKLGVNTVELMPAMEFGNCEIPYMDSLDGKYNTWNPYERNHWGYMTAGFFAPSAYYSENWDEFKWNEWMGVSAQQVKDFKDMVKAFHEAGIGVMMDVVYNHLSEYETGNLKEIDKNYYFRLDEDGNFKADSFCGNDLKTERPMVRRLIIDSIIYWMQEYHIDGFRFDLGKLLDWETVEEIIREARMINPNVIIVCEPWGGPGGYDPIGFSVRDWGSWNDQIRNGIKGENPFDGRGWIFGEWYGNNDIDRIKSYVKGTLATDTFGLFQKPEHSVNYLASHDGYTFGDFIRLGTGDIGKEQVITNVDSAVKLTYNQMRLEALGALFLFTAQGITMIQEGQEFARTKVIPADIEVDDPHKGTIDHNSYNKDNETNYINYDYSDINSDLFNYYKGLIELRKNISAFRHADPEKFRFLDFSDNEFAFGYMLRHEGDIFLVFFNANQEDDLEVKVRGGDWEILADHISAGTEPLGIVSEKLILPPVAGIVLRKVK